MLNKQLGILGGGQLGRMLIQAGSDWGLQFACLDPDAEAPAFPLANRTVVGDLMNEDDVYAFGRSCDLITIEFEHVNINALKRLAKEGVAVYPQPDVIALIQDKGQQKQFYADHQIPTPHFRLLGENDPINEDWLPCVQKTRTFGYDGKGVQKLSDASDINKAFSQASVIEDLVDIDKELAVIVARNTKGDIEVYDPVEMLVHEEGHLLDKLYSPARITMEQESSAIEIAKKVAQSLQHVGVLAVELFLNKSGQILVNEIAPRPHNSGHHSIEGCMTSQFQQHLRAILGLPLGESALTAPAVMINLIGEGTPGPTQVSGLEDALTSPDIFVHLYNKSQSKPLRKMGHLTSLAQNLAEADRIAEMARAMIRISS